MNIKRQGLKLSAILFGLLLFSAKGVSQEFGAPIVLETFTVVGFHWPDFHYTSWSDNTTTYSYSGPGGGGSGTFSGAQGGVNTGNNSSSAGKTGNNSGHKVDLYGAPSFPSKGLTYKITLPANATGLYVQSVTLTIRNTNGSTIVMTTTEIMPVNNGTRTLADGTTSTDPIFDINAAQLGNMPDSSSVSVDVQSTFIPNATLGNTSGYANTSNYNINALYQSNNPNDPDNHFVSLGAEANGFFHKDGFDSALLTQGAGNVVRGFEIGSSQGASATNSYIVCPSCTP